MAVKKYAWDAGDYDRSSSAPENPRETQVEQLRVAIAGLETQRVLLGDAVVEPALAALRAQLATLEQPARPDRSPQDLSGLPHPAERRVLTVLFADVVGSTGMGSGLIRRTSPRS